MGSSAHKNLDQLRPGPPENLATTPTSRKRDMAAEPGLQTETHERDSSVSNTPGDSSITTAATDSLSRLIKDKHHAKEKPPNLTHADTARPENADVSDSIDPSTQKLQDSADNLQKNLPRRQPTESKEHPFYHESNIHIRSLIDYSYFPSDFANALNKYTQQQRRLSRHEITTAKEQSKTVSTMEKLYKRQQLFLMMAITKSHETYQQLASSFQDSEKDPLDKLHDGINMRHINNLLSRVFTKFGTTIRGLGLPITSDKIAAQSAEHEEQLKSEAQKALQKSMTEKIYERQQLSLHIAITESYEAYQQLASRFQDSEKDPLDRLNDGINMRHINNLLSGVLAKFGPALQGLDLPITSDTIATQSAEHEEQLKSEAQKALQKSTAEIEPIAQGNRDALALLQTLSEGQSQIDQTTIRQYTNKYEEIESRIYSDRGYINIVMKIDYAKGVQSTIPKVFGERDSTVADYKKLFETAFQFRHTIGDLNGKIELLKMKNNYQDNGELEN